MIQFLERAELFSKSAEWLCAGTYTEHNPRTADPNTPHFPILRATFSVGEVKKATLRMVGLGFFHAYLNGVEITENAFNVLSTDYEPRENYPTEEVVAGHRLYVPTYDVTDFLKAGKNVLAVHFGGGWYSFEGGFFGDAKVIYLLTVETAEGTVEIPSVQSNTKIADSYVKTYNLTTHEDQDFRGYDDAVFSTEYDDSAWKTPEIAKEPDTRYAVCNCPRDTTAEVFCPTVSAQNDDGITYDTGKNHTGYPVLKLHAKEGESVEVWFAESANADGTMNYTYNHGQHYTVISDGKERTVFPQFTWFGYRYFLVKGNAEVVEDRFIHTDVKVNSAFHSSSEVLNWIYDAYLNTQLCNMHLGIPSDCPHIERRGYTGDGELICHAGMTLLDSRAFYEKWIGDISDCQDTLTGHIQYTAPYLNSGGGPGAWGCAIVEVPYRFWKHFGDTAPMTALYPQMKRYFDYLEAHSDNLLVTSDKEGAWCLGDWCPPIQVVLPAPFVNNYYYIKSLMQAKEIAELIGATEDIPVFEGRIAERKSALMAAYYNTWDGNFIGGLQGANAFAVDIGIGDDRTYRNLVAYYKQLGRYDTGICGTDLVTRVLFEHGDAELAIALMMSEDPISFAGMKATGATTIWENWPHATWDRSQNHPMFGAVAAYLSDYILGIRQREGTVGYQDLVIEPAFSDALDSVSGKRAVASGDVSVSYHRAEDGIHMAITVPAGVKAIFRYHGNELMLQNAENRFVI